MRILPVKVKALARSVKLRLACILIVFASATISCQSKRVSPSTGLPMSTVVDVVACMHLQVYAAGPSDRRSHTAYSNCQKRIQGRR